MPRPQPPRDARGGFRSWSGVVRTGPLTWHAPTSEAEVVRAVRQARGGRLHAVGAGHSFSDAAAPVQHAVTLDRLAGVVSLDEEAGLATVRAGTRLRDLSRWLALRGWALPVVGSIQAQSVAGAIATGTHGSSLVHGNLATLVVALRLVDGTGQVHEVGAEDPRLDGCRVHLGALGVVTEATLRVTRAFRLRQEVEHVGVEDLDVATVAASAEYVKAWWLPGAARAQVVRYRRTEEPATRRPSSRTLRWVDEQVMHKALFPPLVAAQHRWPSRVPALNDRLSRTYLGPAVQVGASGLLLNTPMPLRHRETEAAVPMEQGQTAVERLVAVAQGERLAVSFPLEVRFVRGDAGWLSPAHGVDTCQVGAYATDGPHRTRWFAALWEAVADLDARPHWGKELHHTADELADRYPQWQRFQQLRDALDPERLLANPFTERVLGP